VREVGEPARDDVADALGDCEASLGGELRPDALEGEQTHDLADEERVALGLLVDRGDQRCRSDLRRCQLDVLRDLALAQPAKRHPTRHRLARDLGQRLDQRPPGNRVDIAVGGEQEDVRRAKLAGEEPQHRLTRSAAIGLALAALTAPTAAAQQQDLRTPDARDAASVGQTRPDLRSPDTRDAAGGRGTFSAPHVTVIKVPQSTPSAGGMDWGDAGIGAGALLALIALSQD
jgi:hypothetical protein